MQITPGRHRYRQHFTKVSLDATNFVRRKGRCIGRIMHFGFRQGVPFQWLDPPKTTRAILVAGRAKHHRPADGKL
jgi:hypothetical protein